MPAADGVLFEFTTRWDQFNGPLESYVDILEERDRSLEDYISDLEICPPGEGVAPMGFFQFSPRWPDIFAMEDVNQQIQVLEGRSNQIEFFFQQDGRCPLDLPYRYQQFWEGLLAGEPWAVACAEENDRAIEGLFANCRCTVVIPTFEIRSTDAFGLEWFGSGDQNFTYTWVVDDNITSVNFIWSVGLTSNPILIKFGAYPSGYPGPFFPHEALTVSVPASGSFQSGVVPYSGTLIPPGTEVGFQAVSTVSGATIANNVDLRAEMQAPTVHSTVNLGWNY